MIKKDTRFLIADDETVSSAQSEWRIHKMQTSEFETPRARGRAVARSLELFTQGIRVDAIPPVLQDEFGISRAAALDVLLSSLEIWWKHWTPEAYRLDDLNGNL